MKLSAIASLIESTTPYALIELRTDPPYIFATLSYTLKSGVLGRYKLALSIDQLEDAIDPDGIIVAHMEMASADIAAASNGVMEGPRWA